MNDLTKQITKADVIRKITDAGFNPTHIETNRPAQMSLACGSVQFDKKPSGLTIHTTNTIENSDGKATSEVSERINILVLMEGCLKFAFNQNQYQVFADKHPVLLVSIINGNEIFTRYFQQNCRVKKVTITVEKSWLLARCKNSTDLIILDKLFTQSTQIYQWSCDTLALSLANELMNVNQSENLAEQLKAEQIGFQLFSLSYNKITRELSQSYATQAKSEHIAIPNKKIAINALSKTSDYEGRIKAFIEQPLTLTEIANKLGSSISTLQRYFKNKHQMTLKEYIRVQKLEQARRSILFEQKTIGEASYFAGYNHVSNFVTAFKKHFDITPAELQKQISNIEY